MTALLTTMVRPGPADSGLDSGGGPESRGIHVVRTAYRQGCCRGSPRLGYAWAESNPRSRVMHITKSTGSVGTGWAGRAFTLIELLVVIVILGVLVSITLVV